MKITCFHPLSLLLLYTFSLHSISLASNRLSSNAFCKETEGKALLQFKEQLTDPSNRLSSWGVGKDCCKWMGVRCSNKTGNVRQLDLKNKDCYAESTNFAEAYPSRCLGGEISISLLDLRHLNYLDLSMNNFQGIPIPNFLGSLEKLRYLNLSYASFGGMVPPHLGNLSNLQFLDLYSDPYSIQNLEIANLNWLTRLSFLEYLNLGFADLSLTNPNWVQALNMLPVLSELHLSGCNLQNLPVSLPTLNFTSLSVLDLSYNTLIPSIPQWVYNISSLVELNLQYCGMKILVSAWGDLCNVQRLGLSGNEIDSEISELVEGLSRCNNGSIEELHLGLSGLKGKLPDSLGNFINLKSLQLYYNSLSGPIPRTIEKLSNLEELDLSYNEMNGSIPESIGTLTKLTYLELCENSWEGLVSENHFQGLKKLQHFSVSSSNRFVFNVSREWVPPFSLTSIEIENCPLGPGFPAWIRIQNQLSDIVLANVSISGLIPSWLWTMSPQIQWLDLSNNQLEGTLPSSLEFSPRTWIDLSSNRLEASLPLWPHVSYLILANNLFSGSIPANIGQVMPSLRYIFLSGNFLNGSIPSSIGKMTYLSRLDLSNNKFSGKIPDQWRELQDLRGIDFSQNKLLGTIPNSMCSAPRLTYLKLSSNSLSGELSFPLQNCTALTLLDLGDNRITGNVPKWIGESLTSLSELRLRANLFTGEIPKQLCSLPHLHVVDLAVNNLSGTIPQCLGNLSDLSSSTSYTPKLPSGHYTYTSGLQLVVKGRSLKYTFTLELVNVIDLSSNRLSGEIPEEISKLSSLNSLNLSRNQLTGKIPNKIGGLRSLETLDLSCNGLSGQIPPSMASVTSLNHLNLSYNNLSGPIPSTNQFLTFTDPSIYEGNPQLCGGILLKRCQMPNERDVEDKDNDHGNEDEDKYEKLWFWISVGLGFIVGFWTVCGSLVMKKSWRDAYFRFLENVKDRLHVFITLKCRKSPA